MSRAQARKPVLYVGGGCLDASAELREFVQRTGIPVAATLMGLGAFPEDHDLALQVRSPCPGTLCWPVLAFQLRSVEGTGCNIEDFGLLLLCCTAMRTAKDLARQCWMSVAAGSTWPGYLASAPCSCCTAPQPPGLSSHHLLHSSTASCRRLACALVTSVCSSQPLASHRFAPLL